MLELTTFRRIYLGTNLDVPRQLFFFPLTGQIRRLGCVEHASSGKLRHDDVCGYRYTQKKNHHEKVPARRRHRPCCIVR